MFKVKAWNTYSLKDGQETGSIVCATDHEALDVTHAFEQAKKLALQWNKKEKRTNMVVNFLTCNGFIRTI